jgi:hypothetical protein
LKARKSPTRRGPAALFGALADDGWGAGPTTNTATVKSPRKLHLRKAPLREPPLQDSFRNHGRAESPLQQSVECSGGEQRRSVEHGLRFESQGAAGTEALQPVRLLDLNRNAAGGPKPAQRKTSSFFKKPAAAAVVRMEEPPGAVGLRAGLGRRGDEARRDETDELRGEEETPLKVSVAGLMLGGTQERSCGWKLGQ